MRTYEYRHVIGFEETNLVGNVYYANHVKWQGRCREMFLREHAPEVVGDFAGGLCLVTLRCSCEYLAELNVFEEVAIRMHLASLSQNQMALGFEYWRLTDSSEDLVARGEQHIACMRRQGSELLPARIPHGLAHALGRYAAENEGDVSCHS